MGHIASPEYSSHESFYPGLSSRFLTLPLPCRGVDSVLTPRLSEADGHESDCKRDTVRSPGQFVGLAQIFLSDLANGVLLKGSLGVTILRCPSAGCGTGRPADKPVQVIAHLVEG